jgi:hypothetical protein
VKVLGNDSDPQKKKAKQQQQKKPDTYFPAHS